MIKVCHYERCIHRLKLHLFLNKFLIICITTKSKSHEPKINLQSHDRLAFLLKLFSDKRINRRTILRLLFG